MSSVVHQTILHMWLKGGTFYKEAARKEEAIIEQIHDSYFTILNSIYHSEGLLVRSTVERKV